MTFQNTVWLFLTPALALVLAVFVAFGLRRRDALLRRFAADRLIARLAQRASPKRTAVKALLVIAAAAGIGLALARPQYGVEWTRREARGLDLVFALDVSRSMLAEDLKPTRLKRAKLAITDLIERLESDRIGLVAFAGRAFLQTPPTLDYAAFRESLRAVDPSIITRGGSDIGQALREAAEAFPEDDNTKIVILLTDGEALEGGVAKAAKAAADAGITVHTVGVGTPEGEYLRVRNEDGGSDFVRNAEGQPVRSRLDESTLRDIAQTTGGQYGRLDADTMRRLNESVLAALPRSQRESEMRERPIERFQWPLLAAFLLLAGESLVRRRSGRSAAATARAAPALLAAGWLLAAPPAPLAAQEDPAEAPSAATAATEEPSAPAPENGPPSGAADAPQPPAPADPREIYNRGVAALRSGNPATARDRFETAIERTEDLRLQRDALYNLGHIAFQTGKKAYRKQAFPEAIDHWKEAESLFRSANQIDGDAEAAEDAAKVKKRREALEAFLKAQKQRQQEREQQRNGETGKDSEQPQSSGGSNGQGKENQRQSEPDGAGERNQKQNGRQKGQQNGQSAQNGRNPSGQNQSGQEPSESGEESPGSGGASSGEDGASGKRNGRTNGESGENRQAPGTASDEKEPPEGEQRDAPGRPGERDPQSGQRPQNGGRPGEGAPEDRAGEEPAADRAAGREDGGRETPEDNGRRPADGGAGAPDGAETEAETAAGGATGGRTTEGMSETEARALLESLRGTERILPFVEPGEREGPRRPVRDW